MDTGQMARGDKLIRSIVTHAESRYDPVKAHDYYLRTRELKGNERKLSDLKTQSQKEGFQYVKSQVGQEKKASEEAARNALASVSKGLQQRKAEISKKFRAIMKTIADTASADREKIIKDAQDKIASLPKIPESIGETQRAKLVAERKAQIAKIRGEANKNLKGLSESTRANKDTTSKASEKQRESVRSELQNTLTQARANYTKAREAIKAKYQTELDKEFDAIRSNVR